VGDLTYPVPGVTRDDGPPVPPGFRTLWVRTALPRGTFEAAADALFAWRAHSGVPLMRVRADRSPAEPGAVVVLRCGPVTAPCRVVWTVREPDRAGFAYGSLPGHPECGEEAFVLVRDPAGGVTFTVHAVSRPDRWYARAAGPLGRGLQHAAARQYARSLRDAVRTP
jgi:uncharacterized protein (UPF0548 family)